MYALASVLYAHIYASPQVAFFESYDSAMRRKRKSDAELAVAPRWESEGPRWEDDLDLENEERRQPTLEELSPAECGQVALEYLDQLKTQGTLSAKQACLIAYWTSRAGAVGLQDIAYPPNRPSGKYSALWDRAFQHTPTSDAYYDIEAPLWRRDDASTSTANVPTAPPHIGLLENGRRSGRNWRKVSRACTRLVRLARCTLSLQLFSARALGSSCCRSHCISMQSSTWPTIPS